MLKLITFDYWNTIFDSSNGIERNNIRRNALAKELSEYGFLDKDFDNMTKEIGEYFNRIWVEKQITPKTIDMLNYIWGKYKIPENSEKKQYLREIFENVVLLYPPKLNPNVKETISKLEEKYLLGIISDTGFSPGTILKSLLNTEEILHYFKYFSFSDETGYSKPNINAFSYILKQANVLPDNAIHIGDIERTDIVGAKAVGMKAIKYIGDETSLIYNVKDKISLADFSSNDWNEIYNWINENE